MAEESGKVNPNPEAAKPAAGAQDATKYVGTPAVGTSKAAAAAGVAGTAPSTEIDRHRRRLVWTMVTGFLMAWFLAFFRFFLPRTLFEPNLAGCSGIWNIDPWPASFIWSSATGSEGKSGILRRWTSGRLNWLERFDPEGHKNP